MLVLHHMTYSINSLCHFFGRRRFDTGDESRNLAWLAPLTFGEAWHNNHHAFPTSAAHGMRRWEVDPSAAVIWLFERTGLAWDVVRVSPRQAGHEARRGAAGSAGRRPARPGRGDGRDSLCRLWPRVRFVAAGHRDPSRRRGAPAGSGARCARKGRHMRGTRRDRGLRP